MASLVVTNANGVVQTRGLRQGCVALPVSPNRNTAIEPGQSYFGRGDEFRGINLTEFGYALAPGTYTIRAVLDDFSEQPIGPSPPTHPVSNSITMTIAHNAVP